MKNRLTLFGMMYIRGLLGDKPTNIGSELIQEAIKIWECQANQGNSEALVFLAKLYYFIKSHKEAVYWLSMSSEAYSDILINIYLNEKSPVKNVPLGLKMLESKVLNHGKAPEELTITNEILPWFLDKANNISNPLPEKTSKEYRFQKFVLDTLVKEYEMGNLGEIDHDLISKYYYCLYIDFECFRAGKMLVKLYNRKQLPTKYVDAVKHWAEQLPTFITGQIGFSTFINCGVLLSKLYQRGEVLPYDVKEATKWLYLALHYHSDNHVTKKSVEDELVNLPTLELNQKERILNELIQFTQNTRLNSSLFYKVMCRILGDIFYNDKIIRKDIDKAIYWYTEASLKNNGRASLALAMIHRLHKEDLESSLKWYVLAVQQGNERALQELKLVVKDHNLIKLSPFLDKYNYQPKIPECEWINLKPYKNLEKYPRTGQDMYELGKYYLKDIEQNNDSVLNAAFWLRKAMAEGSIDAGVEVFSMYKSGILGKNLITVADSVLLQILELSCMKLKGTLILGRQNEPSILKSLNNLSSVLANGGDFTYFNELNQILKTVTSQANDVDQGTLTDILSKLDTLKQDLHSNILDRNKYVLTEGRVAV